MVMAAQDYVFVLKDLVWKSWVKRQLFLPKKIDKKHFLNVRAKKWFDERKWE